MASSKSAVSYTTKGKFAIITLSQPAKLNALTMHEFGDVAALLHEIDARADILVTVLTGTGRFFSAGADLRNEAPPSGPDLRRHYLQQLVAANLYLTHALATHSKILVAALNGPAVGGGAALVAFADFVYAAPSAYLLYPFAALGLVAEVGLSRTLVQRLGISLANEALLMGRKIGVDQLLERGFVNKIFESDKLGTEGKEGSTFLDLVLEELEDSLGDHLNGESLLGIKALIQRPERDVLERQNVAEVFAGVERLASGAVNEAMHRLQRGEKQNKL